MAQKLIKENNMTSIKELDFAKTLMELAELDYNAVEAYIAAVKKISNESYKNPLSKFQQDHERHIKEINEILVNHNKKSVKKPTAKHWVTKGKVTLADIVGDDMTILKAMHSIEKESNQAYEQANHCKDIWKEADKILKQGLEDEKKHIKWVEMALAK